MPAATQLLAPKLRDLFFRRGPNGQAVYIPSRYKIAHGGRGSSKSTGFVDVAVQLAARRRIRALCVRETQQSIAESIHRLISVRIADMGLAHLFEIQKERILGPWFRMPNGSLSRSEFIFAGIKSDPDKIKSAADIDLCIVEEAQKVSEGSWRTLIPTIRAMSPDRITEIWICFNPTLETDETYKRFVMQDPPDCRRVEINFPDNPWFPADLELERQADFDKIAQAKDSVGKAHLQAIYDHIWCGKVLRSPGGAFFREGSILVDGLPCAVPEHVDFVFATMDTAAKTRRQHDGTGVVYWAVAKHGQIAWPLTLLDYDLHQIDAALLVEYLPSVLERLEYYAKATKAIYGSRGVWIEDASSGIVLLQQGMQRGWPVHPIDTKLTSMGTQERALNVIGYVASEDMKICGDAYYRSVTYHGETRNHLLTQVLNFTATVEDQGEDDLLNCFSYGIALSLGNHEGF